MEDYNVQCKLGDGAQGVVYKVQHIQTSNTYAMKVICCADQGQVNLALQEIKVLLQLRHPSIVSYVDFFLVFNSAKLRREFEHVAEQNGTTDRLKSVNGLFQSSLVGPPTHGSPRMFGTQSSSSDGVGSGQQQGSPPFSEEKAKQGDEAGGVPASHLLSEGVRAHWLREEEIAVCLVMELCSNGDMAGTIRETKQKLMETGKHPISEAQILAWMEQCAAALQFIHGKGFLHRDLKPTNVFFDAYRDVKIGDFGLAATVGNGGRKSAVGTPYYLAPERMLQQRYDSKVDVWGLGIIVLELVTLREQPVNSMVLENPAVIDTVVKNVTKLGFSAKLSSLLRDMLQRQPDKRPAPTVVLQRLSSMMGNSPHLGMSASLFVGMSCPKLTEGDCAFCEVLPATVYCHTCQTCFCESCDRTKHKHPSRQSHERTSMMASSSSGLQHQQQLTLSTSRTSPGTLSDQSRSFQPSGNFALQSTSPTVLSHSNGSRNRSHSQFSNSPQVGNSRVFARLRNALNVPPGSSMSISDYSLSQNMLSVQQLAACGSGGGGPGSPMGYEASPTAAMGGSRMSADTVVRVPADFPTLAAALEAVTQLRHIRKILVAGNTVHNTPLTLSKALPENLKIVGEEPSPVLEVADSPFALHCASGKGIVENLIIRHVGCVGGSGAYHRKPLEDIMGKNGQNKGSTAGVSEKKTPPTAVSITGGSWAIRKCRISSVGGNGVTVGLDTHTRKKDDRPPIVTDYESEGQRMHDGGSSLDHQSNNHGDSSSGDEDGADGADAVVDPVVFKCFFMDVHLVGVIVHEGARGLYESNHFSGCGYAAFVLRLNSTARIRANRITEGADAGIVCHDAQGSIEYNLIAQNDGCGVVVRGPVATAIFRKNRVLANTQAGFFCYDRAAPFIADNEISHNHRAGVLIKRHSAPKVSRNVIDGGKEAGIYIFEYGAGIIEENTVRGNQNAGLLVTTNGNPHVIHNTMSKNAYEGIWVCQGGGGTFCDNDLRGNARGAKDVDAACKVTWVGNTES